MKLEKVITTIFLMLVIYDIFRVKPKVEQPQQQEALNQTEQTQEEKPDIQEPEQEDFREDAEYIESSLPIIVEIFYCNRTGLHTQYQELERNIYLTFPKNKNLQIFPAEYPVPELQAKLSQILNYGQYALMGVMFFYKQLFSLLGMPVPGIVEKIVEKKMFVLIGAILLNQYGQNALLATGKMKIFIDSKMIFDQGAPIQTEKVLQLIKTELLKLQ